MVEDKIGLTGYQKNYGMRFISKILMSAYLRVKGMEVCE